MAPGASDKAVSTALNTFDSTIVHKQLFNMPNSCSCAICIRIPSENRCQQQQAEKSSAAAESGLGCVQSRVALKDEDVLNDVCFQI